MEPRDDVPAQIVCVDCGGTCHLLTVNDDDPDRPVAVYRCGDCLDRWDLSLEEG